MYLRTALRGMRRDLVAEVLRVHGDEPSAYQHHVILSATRHEARARLLERWLAETPELADKLKVAILEGIGNASDAVDRSLRALGIDSNLRTVRSQWRQAIDAAALDDDDTQDASGPDATPDDATESQEGTE